MLGTLDLAHRVRDDRDPDTGRAALRAERAARSPGRPLGSGPVTTGHGRRRADPAAMTTNGCSGATTDERATILGLAARRAGIPRLGALHRSRGRPRRGLVDRRRSTASATSTTRAASASRTPATAHPRVAAAIAEQAAKIIHAQQNILYHKPGLELHDRLPRSSPAPARSRARADRPLPVQLGRRGDRGRGQAGQDRDPSAGHRVAFRGGFHGRTHGTMSLTRAAASRTAATTSRSWAASTSCRTRTRCACPPGATPGRGPRAWTMAAARRAVRDAVLPRRRGRVPGRADPRRGRLRRPARWLPPSSCARWPTATASCSSPTRCRPATAAPAASSRPSGPARGPTSWSWPRASRPACRCRGIMARRELLDRFAAGHPRRHVRRQRGRLRGGGRDARRDRGARGSSPTPRRSGERLLAGLRVSRGRSPARRRGARPRPDDRPSSSPTRTPSAPRPDLAKQAPAPMPSTGTAACCSRAARRARSVRVIPPLVTTESEIDQALAILASALDTVDPA